MEGDRKSKIVARKEELVSGVGERERERDIRSPP